MNASVTSLQDNVFRASAGMVLVNSAGEVLALERVDIPGAWQLPQGGLKPGEEPMEAVLRELCEETCIGKDRVQYVSEYPEWLAYELPGKKRSGKTGRGQVQKWFLFRFSGSSSDIDLNRGPEVEFHAWKWMPFPELVERAVSFRADIYRKLMQAFGPYLKSQ